MAKSLPPHGGLTEPIQLTVSAGEKDAFLTEASSLARVPVSNADLSTVYRFADGALSPLSGPMDADTYHRVLDEAVIEVGGQKYAWTIPLGLPVKADLARKLEAGQKVALENSTGEIVATLEISDVFAWDKDRYLRSVYGTERTDHPGADMVL